MHLEQDLVVPPSVSTEVISLLGLRLLGLCQVLLYLFELIGQLLVVIPGEPPPWPWPTCL